MSDACHHAYLIARVAVCQRCGELHMLPEGCEPQPEPAVVDRLTPRQRAAMTLAVAGYSQHEIAEQMGVSYHTALCFLRGIYRRLGAHSQTQMVAMYFGLIPLGRAEDVWPEGEPPIEQAPAWSVGRHSRPHRR